MAGYFPDTDAGADSVSNGVVVTDIDVECNIDGPAQVPFAEIGGIRLTIG